MNLRLIAGLSFALTFGATFALHAQVGGRVGVIGGADAAILKTVIGLQCQATPGQFLLLYSTPIVPSADHLPHDNPGGAAGDIVHRAAGGSVIPSDIGCAGVKILDNTTLDDAMGNTQPDSDDRAPPAAMWERLPGVFPNAAGFMSMSLPGYTPSGDEAVVYMRVRCRVRCGKGEYVYLHHIYRHWVVVKRVVAWAL
jgi:hypothetical protein